MPKIALLGAGRIGRIHAANAVAHPDLTLSHVDPMAANPVVGEMFEEVLRTWFLSDLSGVIVPSLAG